MTLDGFRKLALALPEAGENAHMGHPDFRVRGRIFATLCAPDEEWGMVKLTPEQQTALVEAEPTVFVPVKGGWGRRGATNVRLRRATARTLAPALEIAWRNVAPALRAMHATPDETADAPRRPRPRARRRRK
jgi:hypothetical protein